MSIPNIKSQTEEITINDEKYHLRKFRVIDFLELKKACEKVLDTLAKNNNKSDALKELALMQDAYAETVVVITCGSTFPSEKIIELDHIAHRELFAKVMEFNSDFFVLAALEMAADIEKTEKTTDGDLEKVSLEALHTQLNAAASMKTY